MVTTLLWMLGAVTLLLALAPSALANTFTVTRTNDPALSSNPCRKHDCSLRAAVAAADGHAGEDTIQFAGHLSGETIVLSRGELRIRRELTIAGPAASKLTVSANDLSRVFHMRAGHIVIRGITITAGREAATPNGPTCPGDSASSYTAGGGILQNAGTLELRGVKVSDSAVRGPSGSILGGGGIATIDGTLSLVRSHVTEGVVNGGSISGGGGILNCVGKVTLTRSTVEDSSVSAFAIGEAGGVANGLGAAQSTGELTLDESTVAGNDVSSQAISQGGGAMTTGGPVTVNRSTIADNSATVTGGGSISDGGGFLASNSEVKITNSTITNNKAIAPNAAGGGIVVGGTGPPKLVLRSSTLVRNRAKGTDSSRGGNLLGSSFASLLNTIVAGGVATSGSNCDGAVKSSGHDLEDANTCGFDSRGDRVNTDPKLLQLEDNGGPTQTIALRRASPAIDNAARTSSPKRDQRGFKRDDKPDIGAYEFGAKP